MEKYFNYVRAYLFSNKMSSGQVEGQEAIIKACKECNITDRRWVAYMLATAYHETARTMQPIEEYGKGRKYDYGKKLRMSRVPYVIPNKIYYGRGYVQLTWYENYEKMGKILAIDLLNHPELALKEDIAAKIMIEGMIRGTFTGASLAKYFNATKTDWVNARKIINGLDKAELIAKYAQHFYKALILL